MGGGVALCPALWYPTTVAWLHHIKATGIEVPGRLWHKNYYERIIRNDELESTRQHIRNNPTKSKQPPTTPT